MKKNKWGFHYVPILNDEYGVFLCFDPYKKTYKKVQAYFSHSNSLLGSEYAETDDYGRTFLSENTMPVIWVDKKEKYAGLATLSHEACHAIRDIFDFIGQKDIPDEIFAHSVGAVVRYAQNKKML